MDPKIYTHAQELESFFQRQVRTLLPKYAKTTTSLSNRAQELMPMSLHDLIDDIEDPKDEDYAPNNSAKRKRSTPSV